MARVLLTVQHLRFGGMEKMVAELARGLASRGHVPTVVGLYPGGPFDEILRAEGIEVHTGLVTRGSDPGAVGKLVGIARDADCEVAIAATGGAQHAPAVTLAATSRIGISCARWAHGTPEAPLTGMRRVLEAWMRRRGDAVVALSTVHAEALERYWRVPRAQLRVIANGEELPEPCTQSARAALRSELGIPTASFVVGLVATFRPVKRHEILLRAAAALLESLPELHLLLVGDGETRSACEALVQQLGLRDRVTFTGARVDAMRLYGAMDLHALCSYPAETFPLCLVEAMGAGVVPIATRVGGVPDIVEHGVSGILIEPEAPGTLAAAMLELARDPERRTKLSEAAALQASRRFTRDAMVSSFEELLGQLTRRRRDA